MLGACWLSKLLTQNKTPDQSGAADDGRTDARRNTQGTRSCKDCGNSSVTAETVFCLCESCLSRYTIVTAKTVFCLCES